MFEYILDYVIFIKIYILKGLCLNIKILDYVSFIKI